MTLGIGMNQLRVECIILGTYEVVLHPTYLVCHRGRLILFLVETELLDDGLHKRPRVALVVDGKLSVIAYGLTLHAQDM